MPELPDLDAYVAALRRTIVDHALEEVHLLHPFLLRSVETPPEAAAGRRVASIHRLGKRIVVEFEDGPFFALHLMIAGRLRWRESSGSRGGPGRRPPSKGGVLARLVFDHGELALHESGSRRRASLHVVAERDALAALDPGGLELLDEGTELAGFARVLRSESHTVKRALTDPRLFAGIGNAYSDEILFAAKLSPFAMTGSMDDEELARLFAAARATLTEWRDRLIAEAQERFPSRVTAFRPEMRVHGRYNEPCTVCGTPVQRIRYAENECDYCPTCQAGGKVYADRALSRLLKSDWPRSVEELERLKGPPTSR